MGWIKRLFGSGKVKISFTTFDGQTGTAKTRYEGDINILDLEDIKRVIEFEHDIKIKTIKIVDVLED